jgi:hypothetical protein
MKEDGPRLKTALRIRILRVILTQIDYSDVPIKTIHSRDSRLF